MEPHLRSEPAMALMRSAYAGELQSRDDLVYLSQTLHPPVFSETRI